MKRIVSLAIAAALSISLGLAQSITPPEKHFGFTPGNDRMLFSYEQLIEYLKLLDTESNMFKLVRIGTSPMGKPIYTALISSAQNIVNLKKLKEINRELALNPTLSAEQRDKLIQEGRVFVLATLSMHSTEVGPSQAFPLITYKLLTDRSPELTGILNRVVFMAVPCHNPDGMDMVVGYYNQTKGSIYEGSRLPMLYHKYVGHDNNRDFITLTQSDTKAISALTSQEWFPQVMVEKHQMGLLGPRYFVPPFHDPIAENIEPELFVWTGMFGQAVMNDLTEKGFKGISQHNLFDNYWPGSTETCLWKNVISFLTEAASARIAKPVYIEPTELSAGQKGLPDYTKRSNFPDPWPGGWWRLSDIVSLEVHSTLSILRTAATYKERILRLRNSLCEKQVEKGKNKAPYFFILPKEQKDISELVSLVDLLKEHGVKVYRLSQPINLNTRQFCTGDIVIPLAQPFRMFIKEVMERQHYPERLYDGSNRVIPPYDVASWSLPLHRGLSCYSIDTPHPDIPKQLQEISSGKDIVVTATNSKARYAILSCTNNQAYRLAFTALKRGIPIRRSNKPITIENVTLPAGSFILKSDTKTQKLLNPANFPITYTDNPPESYPLKKSRIALIDAPIQSHDAGWTRYILDTYEVDYTTLTPEEVKNTDIAELYDVIVIPSQSASILKYGYHIFNGKKYPIALPEKFIRGMEKKGITRLIDFIAQGGRIIAWEDAVGLFTGVLTGKSNDKEIDFKLPFDDIGNSLKKKVRSPGSLIRLKVTPLPPYTYGINKEVGIIYKAKHAFETHIPNMDIDRRVIGHFEGKNMLLSGYITGEKELTNKVGALWIKKQKGELILLAFSPIYRASVPATYKFLFNALFIQ